MENATNMNNQTEIEVIDNYEVEETHETENEGDSLLGMILKGVITIGSGIGLAALLIKRRKNKVQRAIETVQKAGYGIYSPEEVEKNIEADEVVYVNTDEKGEN